MISRMPILQKSFFYTFKLKPGGMLILCIYIYTYVYIYIQPKEIACAAKNMGLYMKSMKSNKKKKTKKKLKSTKLLYIWLRKPSSPKKTSGLAQGQISPYAMLPYHFLRLLHEHPVVEYGLVLPLLYDNVSNPMPFLPIMTGDGLFFSHPLTW